jgi:uncharacterized protein
MLQQFFKSLFNIIIGVAIGIPLFFYPYLYGFQDHLLFYPQPLSAQEQAALARAYPGTEVRFSAADGTVLHGWLRRDQTDAPLLIYFGGNAEEVSWLLAETLPGWSLLLMNYRGYGGSAGRPSEQALFSDALELYDHFGADAPAVALMGRSLGTGVAVYVAHQRPVKALVLVTPYDSIRAVAQRIYPFVPVSWLLKHPFDSLARAADIRAPMLAMIAAQDEIIPPRHADTLIAAWGGSVQVQRYPHADHNSIASEPDYWLTILAFLNAALETSAASTENSAYLNLSHRTQQI